MRVTSPALLPQEFNQVLEREHLAVAPPQSHDLSPLLRPTAGHGSHADDPTRLRAAIASETDPIHVMHRVVEAALVLLEPADGSTVELDDRHGHMVYVCASGSLKPFEGLEIPLDGSLSGLAVRSGRLLRCDDTETDTRVNRDACRRVGARSMICVPLRRQSEPVGVLKVSSGRPRAFSESDLVALEALSDFVAVAIGGATDLVQASGRALAGSTDEPHPLPKRSMARFVADVLRPGIAADADIRSRIERIIARSSFSTVFQPIVDVITETVVGVEALTRFRERPQRGPDALFAEAHAVGLGVDLELAAAEAALAYLDRLPEPLYMSVNASPEVLVTERFASMCTAGHPRRVVVELTEHVAVADYPDLLTHLDWLRSRGVRLAIDDTGAGISSLAHILQLGPDIIKLDRSLTTGIDADPVRRSLATALVAFAVEIGAHVVAEGVERAEELAALRVLGITKVQGYHVGRPAPLQLLRCARRPSTNARSR